MLLKCLSPLMSKYINYIHFKQELLAKYLKLLKTKT